jgi:hypothetical protein
MGWLGFLSLSFIAPPVPCFQLPTGALSLLSHLALGIIVFVIVNSDATSPHKL